jgi:hypothetical protein
VGIYVPGLGDQSPRLQATTVFLWRLHGMRGVLVPMHWAVVEPFEKKLDRLLYVIDQYTREGYEVSLVGSSAGATAILNAFDQRKEKIYRLICICGKIHHPETVSSQLYAQNPAFKESIQYVQTVIRRLSVDDRARILCVLPHADTYVPVEDSRIKGTFEKVLPISGHAVSIGYALTLGSGSVLSFLK